MMKRIRFLGVIFFLTCAILPAAPPKYLKLIPQSAPAVFILGEKIELDFDLTKSGAEAASLEIEYYNDRTVYSKNFNANDLKTSRTIIIPIKLFGVFRCRLSLKDRENNIIETDEITFARIRDVSLKTPLPDSPFGIGSYFAMRFNPQELALGVKMQQLLGATWNREELLWDIVEPQKGKWTWGKTDRMVKACHDHNILILGLLDYWGKWTKPFTDESYNDYANYVKKVVERYKPGGVFAMEQGWEDGYGITHWEIWNEPATFWTGSGEQFGRLLKEAYKAAKSADPTCRVFFSEAGEGFNKGVVRVAGSTSFDGVTPHYYCPPRTPEEGEVDKNMANTPGNFEKLHVTGKPFWVSEFGWHSTMDPGQMRHQANCLVRTHVYGLAAGLDKFFWYNFVNDNKNKNDQHFGLVNREDWTPRFGYGAFASMVFFLRNCAFYEQVSLLRPVKIFVFEKGLGSVTVLWSSGAAGSLSLPLPRRSKLFDIMSNRITNNPIPLGPDPVYLVAPDTSAESMAYALREANVNGISSAELRFLPLLGSLKNRPGIRIMIENIGQKPLEGTLDLAPPEGWILSQNTLKVDQISSGNARTLEFSFSGMKLNPDNRYKFQASFKDTRGSKAISSDELSELVALYGSPEIDGNPADWKNARYIHLDTPDKAVGLVPYMDWNLSARVAAMWDKENFYFLGIVRDNAFHQDRTGETLWEGDSFQIGFDTSPEQKDAGKHLFGLAKTQKGFESWSWPVAGKSESRSVPEIKFSFTSPEKDVYIYEAAIPKTLLQPLEMKEGARFGFTILLNDNDGGGRRGWLEWTPGIGTGFAPKYFTRGTLVR